MNRKLIKAKNHDEWLASRSHGIGSSEVATLLGLNAYETPYQLWRRKLGLDAPKEENEAMLLGHIFEDGVAQRWRIATGREIIKSSAEEWLYVHPDYDYFRASPDRIYYNAGDKHNEENKRILECKTTVLDIDADSIPPYWFCQVQWQMYVTGIREASVAWINMMKREFGYKDLRYDEDFCMWMAEEARKFWQENIEKKIEPNLVNIEDVKLRYPKHLEGKTISGNELIKVNDEQITISEAIKKLRTIKDEISELAGQQERIEAAIKERMQDAEAVTMLNGTKTINIASWKAAKDSLKFDAKAYQKEHPEEAQQYMRSVAGSRRFLIK